MPTELDEIKRLIENQRRRQLHQAGIAKPPPPLTPEEIEAREWSDALARKLTQAELDPVRFRETIERGDRYNVRSQ